MKTMKLITPLALALAVMLAGAGCKHEPTKLTQLPASPDASVGEAAPQPTIPTQPQLPAAPPYTPDTGAGGGVNVPPPKNADGTIPLGNPDLFDNMIEDRAAFTNNTVHFDFDSAVVKDSESANLQAVATVLGADATLKLLIEGNCDERGTEEYNRSLGERRALAIREALAKLNLDAARVRTISYGKDKPVDPGHDSAAWAKNRRGDFVLLHPNPNAAPGAPKP